MSRNKLYVGKAGQYIAMSEFLMRGWNVAIPEVDIGDDIFVVKDATGEYLRIQVKTSNAVDKSKAFAVQFKLSYKQLETSFNPDLIYFLIIRYNSGLNKFIIIKRDELLSRVQLDKAGSVSKNKKSIQLYFSINKDNDKVTCSSIDFTEYVSDFQSFPKINHDILVITED